MDRTSPTAPDPRLAPRPGRKLLDVVWQAPLWALPFALFFGTLFGARWPDYVLSYKVSLVFSYCISLAVWGVKRVMLPNLMRCDYETERRKLNWQIGLTISAACLVASYVAAFIVHSTILPGFLGTPRAVIVSGMFSLLFITLFSGINYAIVFYRQAVERARAVEQARAELAQAELRALRAQINPHFLFNTLNTIASLIAENPRAAEDTTTRLAEVFRYALQASDRERAPLGDELAFVRAYLEIERARFGSRLRVVEAVEPGLESVPVPSLLLQPLVENAVRHGAAARTEGGTIRLDARRRDGHLVVEVGDDGPGFDGDRSPRGAGFGLYSVRERLRAAGLPDALTIESSPGRGTCIRLTLPLPPDTHPSTPE